MENKDEMIFSQFIKDATIWLRTCVRFSWCRLFRLPAVQPRFIRIETANVCNLRCKMCPQSDTSRNVARGFMSERLFKKIVDQITAFQKNETAIFYLHISGEPLLHKNIVEFIRYASDKGIKPILTTNAMLLSPEITEKLLRSGLYKIEFSFEGINKEIYEDARRGAVYEVALKNIMGFLERNHACANHVLTELVVVDLPYIEQQLIRDFCQKMQPYFDTVNLSGYFDWLGKVASAEFERVHYSGCSATDTDLNVLWNGIVVPCCMDVDGEIVIGDFNKMSYAEILSAQKRQMLRYRLRTRKINGLLCQRCPVPWGGRKVRGSSCSSEILSVAG